MQPKAARNMLLFLLVFPGLGALFGSGVFIISPDGKLPGMLLSMPDRYALHFLT